MDRTTFLRTILRGAGYYCLLIIDPTTKKRLQKFYQTIESLEQAAVHYDGLGRDVYYSVASLQDTSSREAENANEIAALFIDIDAGEKKPYADQVEAISAFKKFCKKLSLPRPLLVNSGRGIHAYWVLSEPISAEEWLPVATALKAATLEKQFKCDTGVIADLARVLRIPGTHNYKDDPPKEVSVLSDNFEYVDLEQFASLLPVAPMQAMNIQVAEGAADNALMGILAGNAQSRFKTILQKTMRGTGCAQLKIIATEQADVEEPLWRAGLSIAQHCVDRDKAVHTISDKHPHYDWYETETKSCRIKGPYLCERFDEFNPGVCRDCKHWGKIKSPIVLGREIIEATDEDRIVTEPTKAEKQIAAASVEIPGVYEIPHYPHPYVRGKNGGIYLKGADDDGEPMNELIYHNDLYVIKRLRDAETGEGAVMRLHLPKDGVREFTMPLTAITSRDKFREIMAKQGVAAMKMDKLMSYVTTWINELQAQSMAEEARRQFGWTDRCESFVLGEREYTANGVGVNHPSSATAQYFPFFEESGTLQDWKEMIAFYDKPGMELHQLIICSAFGSPLMRFIPGVKAAGLHIYSQDSGFGKTTTLFAAMSVWGRPDRLVVSDNDTRNFKMNRGEIYKNIPMYIDEVTNTSPKELSDIAYQLTSGQQRGRMGSHSNDERHRGDAWELLSVTTGNTSMIERISSYKRMPKAEAQRIMEMRVEEYKFDSKGVTDDFNKLLEKNYGTAGPVFVRALLQDVTAVEELVSQVQKKVDTKLELTSKNRFWSAWFTATIAGAVIARKLGLITFDINGLMKVAGEVARENQENSMQMSTSVQELITQYIYENKGSILQIRSTDDRRHREGSDLDSLIVPSSDPNFKVVGRFETDTLNVFLIPAPFKRWCIDQQINYSNLMFELKDAGVLKRAKVRLTKGTPLQLPPVDALVIDCSNFNLIKEMGSEPDDDTSGADSGSDQS